MNSNNPNRPKTSSSSRPVARRQVTMKQAAPESPATEPKRTSAAPSSGRETAPSRPAPARSVEVAAPPPRNSVSLNGREASAEGRRAPVLSPSAAPRSTANSGRPSHSIGAGMTPASSSRASSTEFPMPRMSSPGGTPRGSSQKKTSPSSAPLRTPAQKRGVPSAGKKTAPSKRSRTSHRAASRNDDHGGSTLVSSLLKSVIYIMSILVVSGVLSYFAINIGNDVFAFIKSGEEVQLTVEPGTDTKALGELLADHGVIRYPGIFDFYVGMRYGKSVEFEPGDYTVSPSMSYDSLFASFFKSNKVELVTVVVSIPEGYTVKQIINTLVNKYGLSSEEELTEAIQHGEFDYWFIDEMEKNGVSSDRVYRLEGYLYPDTYYYYSNASAETIINKMLKNFDTKMKNTFKKSPVAGDTYQEKILNLCKERDMTFDEIVTLASMIQMEAKYDFEYPSVSAVFNNRLRNPSATNGKLESDATIQYVLEERNPDLTKEELAIDNPYNTYLYKGLPPGAITNPTYLSINYALYPDLKCGYYYFVASPDGTSLFAKTLKQHEENIKLVKEMMKDS